MVETTLHLSLPVDDLDAARTFYEDALGCRVGRVRDDWFDVWFFGLQLTLQLRPDELIPFAPEHTRHFGVVFDDEAAFRTLVDRIENHRATWIVRPSRHDHPDLDGKLASKLADPAGNVIEIKYYAEKADWRG